MFLQEILIQIFIATEQIKFKKNAGLALRILKFSKLGLLFYWN